MIKFFVSLITALITVTTFAQDVIIKKDGAQIPAKVIEITDTHVKYKQDTAGPLYNLPIKDILKINYASGKSDFFGNTPGKIQLTKYDSLMRASKINKAWGGVGIGTGIAFIGSGSALLALSNNKLNVVLGTVLIVGGVAELILGPVCLVQAKKQRTAAQQYKPTAKLLMPYPVFSARGAGAGLRVRF